MHKRGVRLALVPANLVRKRPLRNNAERDFVELATQNGWSVTKRGWPDFICFGPDREVIAVEVKPSGKNLTRYQVAAMEALSAAGIRCYVSDGVKLVPYSWAAHGSKRSLEAM